ncbi:MAG TPA: hypothetical protein VKE88_03075 [Candidatus Nanoarchaeia archaeon]|nr:hypothetical protein [Candidatus Nanoarchaeia archaeon]
MIDMTRKIGVSLFVLFLLFFATGCKQQETSSLTGKAFVGGTDGLQMTFLTGLPPADVFDIDSPFQIGVKVENKGEFDITNAQDIKVSITGINPSDFKVTSSDLQKSSPDPLKGVSIDTSGNVVAGDYTTIEFPEMQYFTTVSGSVPFTVRANVCYEYGTKTQGQLCIRKDLRGVSGEAGVCNPNREVPAENSGAPVRITNIKQNVAGPNKVDFFFTITQSGSATDSLHKMGTACDTTLANRDVVWVEVTDTGLGDLSCSGLKDGNGKTTGFVTLFNGVREVRCSQTVTSPDDFEKVVNVNMKYAYKEFIDTRVTLKHAS